MHRNFKELTEKAIGHVDVARKMRTGRARILEGKSG